MKKVTSPLTSQQSQLIVDYLTKDNGWNRIKQCIKKTLRRDVTPNEMDDYIGIAHIALIKSAKNYNFDKGTKFSSFAYTNIANDIKSTLTQARRKKRYNNIITTSINTTIYDDFSIEDFFVGDEDVKYDAALTVIKKKKKELNKFERNVLYCRMYGYSMDEIKKILHCSDAELKAVIDYKFKSTKIITIVSSLIESNRED